MTSTSTRFTSSKSSVIFDPLSLYLRLSIPPSAPPRIRPMSRIVVLSPIKMLFSILRSCSTCLTFHARTNCNTSTIRNHLNYWP